MQNWTPQDKALVYNALNIAACEHEKHEAMLRYDHSELADEFKGYAVRLRELMETVI